MDYKNKLTIEHKDTFATHVTAESTATLRERIDAGQLQSEALETRLKNNAKMAEENERLLSWEEKMQERNVQIQRFETIESLTDKANREELSNSFKNLSGRSQMRRNKKVGNMNESAKKIKTKTQELMKIEKDYSDDVIKKDSELGHNDAMFDIKMKKMEILEEEYRYQTNFIKVYGSNNAEEQLKLALFEMEFRTKQQNLLTDIQKIVDEKNFQDENFMNKKSRIKKLKAYSGSYTDAKYRKVKEKYEKLLKNNPTEETREKLAKKLSENNRYAGAISHRWSEESKKSKIMLDYYGDYIKTEFPECASIFGNLVGRLEWGSFLSEVKFDENAVPLKDYRDADEKNKKILRGLVNGNSKTTEAAYAEFMRNMIQMQGDKADVSLDSVKNSKDMAEFYKKNRILGASLEEIRKRDVLFKKWMIKNGITETMLTTASDFTLASTTAYTYFVSNKKAFGLKSAVDHPEVLVFETEKERLKANEEDGDDQETMIEDLKASLKTIPMTLHSEIEEQRKVNKKSAEIITKYYDGKLKTNAMSIEEYKKLFVSEGAEGENDQVEIVKKLISEGTELIKKVSIQNDDAIDRINKMREELKLDKREKTGSEEVKTKEAKSLEELNAIKNEQDERLDSIFSEREKLLAEEYELGRKMREKEHN